MKKIKVLFLLFLMTCILPISIYASNTTKISIYVKKLGSKDLSTLAKLAKYTNTTYNDPKAYMQWGLFTVGADLAHDMNVTGTNKTDETNEVIVAVLDTGIDYNHSDLELRYIRGGYDFINDDNDPKDDNGHGTHCAGIIAAEMNNSEGIVGIAPHARIMAYKVLDAEGSGYFDNLSQALEHIVQYHSPKQNLTHGVDVISMSLGGYPFGAELTRLQNAIQACYDEGIILVGAAGNEAIGDVNWPAQDTEVIPISAIAVTQKLASYSNWGTDVLLRGYAAPGGDWIMFGLIKIGILSTVPGGYAYYCGTSMATPMVAGIIALLLGNETAPANIANELDNRAKDLGSSGDDQFFGHGLARIVPNNWDYNTWFHDNYDDDILLTYIMLYMDTIVPEPPIDWVTWAIIGGVIVFFAAIAIHEGRYA